MKSNSLHNLTIAIVTRNRPRQLHACLRSLHQQEMPPLQTIIVDNDISQSAYTVYYQWKDLVKGLRYHLEKTPGISSARNAALKKCQTKYIAFIDDDCLLDTEWMRTAFKLIMDDSYDYFVGLTKPSSQKKLPLLFAEMNMKSNGKRSILEIHSPSRTEKNSLIYHQGLNTRNAIIKMDLVRKHQLTFDAIFNRFPIGGGEDSDFGYQLIYYGARDKFAPNLIVFHDEPNTIWKVTVKAFYRGITQCQALVKWGSPLTVVNLSIVSEWVTIVRNYRVHDLKNENDIELKIALFIYYRFIHFIGFNYMIRKIQKNKNVFGLYYYLKKFEVIKTDK